MTMIRWIPERVCAICSKSHVNWPHRICSTCFREWKEDIQDQSTWVVAMVELADAEHALARKDWKHRANLRRDYS